MGCLFGYFGKPADGLLDSMAKILAHRCKGGSEQSRLTINDQLVAEIGHGIPPWSRGPQVAEIPEKHLAFGYSGVFFNSNGVFSDNEIRNGNGASEAIADSSNIRGDIVTFEKDPEKTLQSLEGAFVAALALGDHFYLSRDPAGIKVVYWTLCGRRLLFASEIKALFADPEVPRKMRIGALPEYLTFSFIPGKRTMFDNIHELQPGSMLTFSRGEIRTHRYFVFERNEWDGKSNRTDSEYTEQVRIDLEQSVRECCEISGSPPAVFVSGGIDSSLVLAILANQVPQVPIKTFSVHFGAKYENENEFVSMIQERYRTDHTWLEIRPSKFIKQMRRIIWSLDDPIGDPITVPNFLLAQAASRVTGVVLNGEGGDPCFGGPKNIPMMLSRLYGPLPGETESGWLERNYLLSYKKCFSDLAQILNPDVLKASGGEEALIAILRPFFQNKAPKNFLNKLMNINIRLKGGNLILVKVDKMTSVNGLLALAPLFSKRIIEASMACPPGLKLVGNVEKAILKLAVRDIVPEPIVHRPKSGMMVPVRFWFQKEMRRYAKKVLSRSNLGKLGFFNIDYVKSLLKYDKTEIQSARYGLKLWMLITFMLWYEQMVEGKK